MSIVADLRARGLLADALGDLLGVALDERRTRAVHCLSPSAHRHGDRRASAVAKPRAGRVDCAGCGASWGLLDVGVVRGVGETRAEVAAELERRYLHAGEGPRPRPGGDPPAPAWRDRLARARSLWARSLAHAPDPANAAARAVSLAAEAFTRAEGGVEGTRGLPLFLLPVRDVGGELCGLKLRRDPPFETAGGGTRTLLARCSRPGLLNLGRLLELGDVADPLVVVAEGESDALALQDVADRGRDSDLVALSPSHGAIQCLAPLAPLFRGRRVAVVFDEDRAGRNGAENAVRDLASEAADLRVVRLPLTAAETADPRTNDLRHWLGMRGSVSEFLGLVDAADPVRAREGAPT